MSKKQKVDPQVQQQKSLQLIDTPSVGESALTSEATGLMDAIHSGDYTKRPKNVFFNFADPAQRDNARRMQMNAGGQGVYGLGSPDVNLLAMEKQNLDDQWARDTAGQYEQDWSQAGVRAAGALGDVAGMENSRKLARLGATTGAYNAQVNKPSWWQILLQQAGQGAQAAAMAI